MGKLYKIGDVKHIAIDSEKIQIHLEKDSVCYYIDVDMQGRTSIIDILKNVGNEENEATENEEEEFDMDCDKCPLYKDSDIPCASEDYEGCLYDFIHEHIKGTPMKNEKNEVPNMRCSPCPLNAGDFDCTPSCYDDCVYDLVHKHIKGVMKNEENEVPNMRCSQCPLYVARIKWGLPCKLPEYDYCMYEFIHEHIKGTP